MSLVVVRKLTRHENQAKNKYCKMSHFSSLKHTCLDRALVRIALLHVDTKAVSKSHILVYTIIIIYLCNRHTPKQTQTEVLTCTF